VGIALLSWGASALYTLKANPEIAFFKAVAEKKLLWSEKVTRESGHKTVIYGGSSCLFSIDAERLTQEHRLPSANAGLVAGIGANILTQFALSQTRAGDTLVVALEPDLLAGSLTNPSLGVQFSMAMGHPEWLDGLDAGERYSRVSAVLAMRPGGFHFFTLLGKCFSRKPLYRYSSADTSPSGWQQTAVRLPIRPVGLPPAQLPEEIKRWLKELRKCCRRREVDLFYSLPWGFTPADNLDSMQNANAAFLLQIAEFMPVLKDPRLGAYTEVQAFADTSSHLVPEAARLRTAELADQIQNRRVWSRSELTDLTAHHLSATESR